MEGIHAAQKRGKCGERVQDVTYCQFLAFGIDETQFWVPALQFVDVSKQVLCRAVVGQAQFTKPEFECPTSGAPAHDLPRSSATMRTTTSELRTPGTLDACPMKC